MRMENRKPKILAIVGSLRKDSFNRTLAQKAGEILADRADFEVLDFSDVPLLNQDEEYPAPEAVRRVRDWLRGRGIETTGLFGAWEYVWSDRAFAGGRSLAQGLETRPGRSAPQR